MTLPLLYGWRLHADTLPESLLPAQQAPAFSLPGAQALAEFSDLLDIGPEDFADGAAQEEAHFSLPALLDPGVTGQAELTRTIDFGLLSGERAVLTIDRLCGRGEILLGETRLARFGGGIQPEDEGADDAFGKTAAPCSLALDLSDALRRARRETLSVRFDESRPAGVPGPVMLEITQCAFLSCVSLHHAPQQTLTVRAKITALRSGFYALRALHAPARPDGSAPAAREITMRLAAGESKNVELSLRVPGAPFVPGVPYDGGTMKLRLFFRREGSRKEGIPCDGVSLLCGYPGRSPQAYMPVDADALCRDPQACIDALQQMHLSAIGLDRPVPDGVYRMLTRAGVAVVQAISEFSPARRRLSRLPCVTLAPKSEPAQETPAGSAWQLCGLTGYTRAVDPKQTEAGLLLDAAGLRLDPQSPDARSVLAWLRAVLIRQRAEAARQGRYAGALCRPGEAETPEIADALRTAYAPLHLSALPLSGAWWTGTHFSAAIEAFVPSGAYADGQLTAVAALEDGEGHVLARLDAPVRARGGYVGALECALPESPCVLEITCRLLCGDAVAEESVMPVYVGALGPLEAAFA